MADWTVERPDSVGQSRHGKRVHDQPDRHGGAAGMLEAIPVATFIVQDARHVHCNRAALDLFGLTSTDELGRRPFHEFVHPDERAAAIHRQEAILAGETVDAFVERSPDPDGGWRHLEMNGAPTVWQGEPAAMYVVRDVTDRLRAEERNRSVTARLEAIVDTVRIGAGLVDVAGRLESSNPALNTLLGEDPVGMRLDELVDRGRRVGDLDERGRVVRLAIGPRAGRWVRVTLTALALGGRHGSLVQFEDIDDEVRAKDLLRASSLRDAITDLPNRAGFVREVQASTAHGPTGVLLLDIDGFGVINESLGHTLGDDVLRAVGQRLSTAIRPADTVARLGGDTFAVLAPCLADDAQALSIAERCRRAIADPLTIRGDSLHLRASAGVALGARDEDAERVIARADSALGVARRAGGDRVELGHGDAADRARRRLAMDASLRIAIDHERIDAHLQPIWRIDDGTCIGFESLARWTLHGERIPPDRFVALAEELNLSHRLDVVVASRAAAVLADLVERGRITDTSYLSVNVDPAVLCDVGATVELVSRVRGAGLPPDRLVVEVTERRIPEDRTALLRGVQTLQDAGVRIALDDFGVGQSSLARLILLPFDVLKLDRLFAQHLARPRGCDVVSGVIEMSRRLGMDHVIEGIETADERVALEALGATHGQGWLVAPAMNAETLATFDPGPGRFDPPAS